MAQARLSMRKIRDTLRLKFEAGLSERQIATAVDASRSTVQECLRRCREAEIGWPLPPELDEVALLARIYRQAAVAPAIPRSCYPIWRACIANCRVPG